MSVPSLGATNSNDARYRHTRGSSEHAAPPRTVPPSTRLRQSGAQKTTAAFVRRTLCAHKIQVSGDKGRNTPKPIEDLLPPLTSSNEIDLELYAFIAIIIKDFVYAWYSRITPDHVFVDEVVQVIAHCTRQLEQRLRNVDYETLLLDEIPSALDSHISAYRSALAASQRTTLSADLHQAYHALLPHPALSPIPGKSHTDDEEQQDNEDTWRYLMGQGILAVLLPTEDLQNPCLRSLVAEILSEMIIGNIVCGRLCEPWMIWDLILQVCEAQRGPAARSAEGSAKDQSTRLAKFGLLANREDLLKPVESRKGVTGPATSVSSGIWALVQYIILASTAMRSLIQMLVSAPSLRPRASPRKAQQTGTDDESLPLPGLPADTNKAPPASGQPLVSMAVWSCLARLIELEQRMPWLAGLLSGMHWALVYGLGKVGDSNNTLDRILSNQLRTRVFESPALPQLLGTVRAAIFPNNTLAPARAAPTVEQIAGIKRRASEAVVDVLPSWLCRIYFASAKREDWLAAVDSWLDVFGDPYLNKHLVMRILELLVVRTLPELGALGAEALLEKRLQGP